ncbi:hypothetical protein DAMA08_039060 [Martiniozyma asiatica (nom. inval.)]|nr:hypothetical protein DAMA08_039060 [Martiniozyma asiatica]
MDRITALLYGKTETNKSKDLLPLHSYLISQGVELKLRTVEESNTKEKSDEELKPATFIQLHQFSFSPLVISITNLPSQLFLQTSIESFLDSVLKLLQFPISSVQGEHLVIDFKYVWTWVDDIVLVKFEDSLLFYLFFCLLDGYHISETQPLKLTCNEDILNKVEQQIDNQDWKSNLIGKLDTTVKLILDNNDQDEYTKMYNNYKIDSKDVIDVPPDMIDDVRRQMIDFRLHSLKLEKERREKRKSGLYNITRENHQLDNIEKGRIEQRENKEDIEFAKLLNSFKQVEDKMMQSVNNYENSASYESSIQKSREKFMDRFVHSIQNENNPLDKNYNYYSIHSNYVKFRESVKLEEEKKDADDRKLELDEGTLSSELDMKSQEDIPKGLET